jgi:hypothetical protein
MLENYEMDRFGVIHQIEFTPIKYDKQYISYYEDLSDRTIKLGYQRLGWVLGLLGRIPRSVLEIGYGTGTFIEAAQITGVPDCAGYDIAKYPLPTGVRFVEWDEALRSLWDIVAMFDVLESTFPTSAFLAGSAAGIWRSPFPIAAYASWETRETNGSGHGGCACRTSTSIISIASRSWRFSPITDLSA